MRLKLKEIITFIRKCYIYIERYKYIYIYMAVSRLLWFMNTVAALVVK
jgi:hypothetical protein